MVISALSLLRLQSTPLRKVLYIGENCERLQGYQVFLFVFSVNNSEFRVSRKCKDLDHARR